MFINNKKHNNNIVYVYKVLIMPTITLSIPKDLKEKMNKYPEINWPSLIKHRLEKRAKALYTFEQKRKKREV